MGSPISLYLILMSLTLLSQTHLSFSSTELISSTSDVYDLLQKNGLPKGIIPNNVKSYTISSTGEITIELERTCYVQFTDLVFYEKTIKGKLSYGDLHDVSGIQQKKLFAWFPVTRIEVGARSGTIDFTYGFLNETYPAQLFQNSPACRRNAFHRADLIASM